MTTAATLIDETLQHLYSGTRDQVNTLSGSYTAGGTSLSFTQDLRGIQPGAIVAVDLELFLVLSVSGSTATVSGAFGGSTAANHSTGALAWVNPKFSRFAVFRELNHELASLSSPDKGLFAVKTVDLTYQPAFNGYDLTGVTGIEKLLAVRAQQTGSQKAWFTLGRTDVELQRNHDTDEFASGFSLQVTTAKAQAGRTIRVSYAAPFGALTAEATDPNAAGVGLPATANDIPPLGAALRLAYPREVSRNFHEVQGEPRRAEEVPPGANVNAGAGIARLYDARVKEEAGRLARMHPMRRFA